MKHERQNVRNGFTLVELLVVIAIIALLLAILLPSLSKAKETAKRVVCSSNMKQMSNALNFYLSDNDNNQPLDTMGYWGPGLWQAEYVYVVAFAPYLGMEDVAGVAPSVANSSQDGRFAKYCDKIYPNGKNWNPRGAQFCPSEVRTPNVGWYGNPKFFDPVTSYSTIHVNWVPGTNNTATGSDFDATTGKYVGTSKSWQPRASASSSLAPANMGIFGHSTVDKGPYLSIYSARQAPTNGAKSSCFNYDFGNNHDAILPTGFFDGHVESISADEIQNDRYSGVKDSNGNTIGSTPLWLQLWR